MKTIKQETQDIIFGWVMLGLIMSILMWLQSTNTPPQKTIDYISQYELVKEQSPVLEKYGKLILEHHVNY